MNRQSNVAAYAGLLGCQAARAARSVCTVQKSIHFLQEQGEAVTLQRLVEVSAAFTDTGRRIATSTILRNPQCLVLYRGALPSRTRVKTRAKKLGDFMSSPPTEPELRRAARLVRNSRMALIAHILMVERNMAGLERENATLRDEILRMQLPLSLGAQSLR